MDTAVFDEALIRRYDRPGPRYTSYPTAVQFHTGFGAADFAAAARESNDRARPLSLYVHVPFCASPCFYCGCNKIITRDPRRAQLYLEQLYREIDLVAPLFARSRRVDQLHFGGGTPTFLSNEQLGALLARMRAAFTLRDDPDREYSIEIDPRTVDEPRLTGLASLGFNRVSLGVQDFDPVVQAKVNRLQSERDTLGQIAHARRVGFGSVSVDLIYGLPKQNQDSFARTLASVVSARPDRLAVYSYAHLPHLFKPQKKILPADLPAPPEKLALLGLTVDTLNRAGYVYVGMDHFAVPEDELVRAQRDGSLHRNFQGYSTRAECDLIGLGVSSISKVGDTYSQNAKTLEGYGRASSEGRLAVERGVRLTGEDGLRRDVIQALMCATRLDFAQVERAHGIRFEEHFAQELEALAPLAADGLVVREGRGLRVTARGRLLMRNVAMVFDGYLARAATGAGETPRFSRAV